jgi:thiamine pyrophosphate-dependent acetolactate synthase large subunit-like protein
MAVTNCDLLVAVGARLMTGLPAGFLLCPNAKIVHVDVDPTFDKKNVRVDLLLLVM